MKIPAIAGQSIKVWAAVGILFCLVGCGYRFIPTGYPAGGEGKKVYVAVFANNTPVANIETSFRNAFINRFIKGRKFKVVSVEESADLLLKANIKNLITAPLAYRSDRSAIEQRLTVTLALTLEGRGEKTVFWHDENFTFWGDYAAEGSTINAAQASRQTALAKLADDTAERAYGIMTADF